MFGGDDDHYDVELNKDDLSIHWLKRKLNDRWKDGWALKQTVIQGGNTILIFERIGQ
ncbi:hypothetical protein [Cryptosporangium aurantiacum]|uniref:DUF4177 domain-containing protein n=1 Tax=Cryptosporangium aurantiacum TaxID=134849 RepID=A0A1M7HM51_9ACTN|nr:hypothetical protein [Cryptosporangium aurantiacum]SHM29530.1 hypothetical protein SAMN05443668_101229 [Cryptosporangium aurantiacum]